MTRRFGARPFPLIVSLAATLLFTMSAFGTIVVYGTHTDYPVEPGSDLTDVRMEVDLFVNGGEAIMSFTNASISPELSAVFKEIVVDTYDDDQAVGGAVLWNPVILTDTADVGYSWGDSNGLPGYQAVTSDGVPLVELQANPSPVTYGLGPGETLEVQFDTVLADGSDIFDYLAFFDSGTDTDAHTLGFHAISADTVDGESLSGIYEDGDTFVPEPATIGLAGLGALLFLVRRKRR